MEQIQVLPRVASREEAQAHLDTLNEACHTYEETRKRQAYGAAQAIEKSVILSKANAKFVEELAWLWEHGYPLFTFFPYDAATGNHVWPE